MTRKIEAMRVMYLANCKGEYFDATTTSKAMGLNPYRSTNVYTSLEKEGMIAWHPINQGWVVTEAGMVELLKHGQIMERVE